METFCPLSLSILSYYTTWQAAHIHSVVVVVVVVGGGELPHSLENNNNNVNTINNGNPAIGWPGKVYTIHNISMCSFNQQHQQQRVIN